MLSGPACEPICTARVDPHFSTTPGSGGDSADPKRLLDEVRRRVLWIDDQVTETDPVVHGLELEGFSVDCAASGDKGVRLATQQTYDAVLLDLRLSTESGLDVIESLIAADVGCDPTLVEIALTA